MGPSVKFVLPIIDAFPDKKNGGNFCVAKNDKPAYLIIVIFGTPPHFLGL